MKKYVLSLSLVLFLALLANATTVDGRFVVMTNNGSQYTVKLQIKTNTGTDDLGTSTFQFSFNNANLSFPATPVVNTDFVPLNFYGGNYSSYSNWVTRATPTIVSVNIELNVDNAGTLVGTSWTDVCTITFTTTNPAGSSNLQWGLIEVFDGDNENMWTNGVFTNENTNPLPIELSLFSAQAQGRDIQLQWETKTEINSGKFEIQRQDLKNENSSWVKVAEVKASGNSNAPKKYSFTDKKLNSGKYSYRLKMIDVDGTFSYSSIAEGEVELPKDFGISQNYPNPFNPSTKIDYQLPIDSKVKLEIYSISGEKVFNLVDEEQSAGYYTKEINMDKLSSGIYIYRIIALNSMNENKFTVVKKMLMMK